MSQMVTRKGVTEEKEKRQTDSPVKDMKKKMAANAEKEKNAAATDKVAEKPADKPEKADKPAEKTTDKDKKTEKNVDKDKKTEKADKKTEVLAEKPKEDSKGEKSSKTEKAEEKPKKAESRAKVNGNTHNGVSDVTLNANGVTDDALNGTVSADSDDELLVIDDHQDDQDELFPELTYDDTSDVECFEPPTPENAPSRSLTRRSQAKATRTPETPRPASGKPDSGEDSKESKVLKLKDDSVASDRKLRSSDSPKPESHKTQEKQEEKKSQDAKADSQKENDPKDSGDKAQNDKENEKEKMEVEVVIDVEEEEEPRKAGTNFAKSRVKVSPYRRERADHTASSVMANYTGNNTTMEMDITESSFASEEATLDDSTYLSGLRSIRGRRSYKPLKEMTLRSVNRSVRSTTSVSVSEQPSRPTAPVVGRKRKPDADDSVEVGSEATELAAHGKRLRLLDRIAQPFRRTIASTPLPRRATEIVGINTDLPLTAPVASPATFDPESLKASPALPTLPTIPTLPTPTESLEKDPKRCVIM